jgi:hypothetical protein
MEIIWEGTPHPEHDERVSKEICDLLADGLGHVDDLIMHLIEIGDLEDGPLIEVHGHGGKVYAAFIENPKWVTLSSVKNG